MHEKAINVHKKGNEFQKNNQGTLLQEQKFKKRTMCEVFIGCTAFLLRVKKQTNIKKAGKKKGATFGSGTKNKQELNVTSVLHAVF